MSAFHYTAIDRSGKKKQGVIEGDSERQAKQLLKEQGLFPLDIKTIRSERTTTVNRLWSRRGLKIKDVAIVTRQLATLLTAGLPVAEALKAIGEQSETASMKSIILAVRAKVTEGYSLAGSMKEFPRAFSNLYCATVAAGEKSGRLAVVLNRLADYTEQQQAIRQKIQSALIYPSMMILVSCGIVAFLLTFVVPKMVDVFQTLGQELPFMTQLLITISHGLTNYAGYALIILLIIVTVCRVAIKRYQRLRKQLHQLLLKVPLLSRNIRLLNTARFAKTLAILSQSGMAVLEAMTVAAELVTNIPMSDAMHTATARVREGASIHLALKQTQFFPVMSLYLIASGEATGQLEVMLERAATNQEEEMKRFIDIALTLFEPLIILVMGSVVLFIVLAIMLPIFSINDMVN